MSHAALRAIIIVAILVTASASRSAPVIPAAAFFGGFGEQDQARSGTPNVGAVTDRADPWLGPRADTGREASGVPLVAEGRSSRAGFLPPSHVEAGGTRPPSAAGLRTLPAKSAVTSSQLAVPRRAPAAVTGSGVRSSWQRVIASSYGIGDGFLGKKMACGGPLTARDLTVAHRTLPCGSRVQLRFRGCTVTATVTDRGPYVAGRAFDLGPGVARALHFDGLDTIEWRR